MEKIAVYDEEVQLLLLSIDSLITTASKIIDLNNDAPAKYMRKPAFQEKTLFLTIPFKKSTKGLLDSFVERIKFYHKPKVQGDCIFFY